MADADSCVIAVVVASSRVGAVTIQALASSLSRDPSKQGVKIRAVLRDASKGDPSWDPSLVEAFSGFNVNDPASLSAAFRGVSKALLVAPQLENRDEIVNAMLTSAKEQGVRHVVLIGGVFQEEERFLFHRQWMSSRRRAEELGIAWIQLECSDFMENLLRSCRSVTSEGKIYGVFPNGVSSPVALEDIGKAASAVLLDPTERHDRKGYRIVGPQALTPLQVAEKVSAVSGGPVDFVPLSLEESKQSALAAGGSRWQVDGFADWQQLYFATGKLRDVKSDLPALGVDPKPLDKWLEERASLFRHCHVAVTPGSA